MTNKFGQKYGEFYERMEETGGYLKWPDQNMIRIIFGKYTKKSIRVNSDWSVLDVGCGSGNNLLPFLEHGCDCFGVEPAQISVDFADAILKERGFDAIIKQGENRELPFPDDYFDLLISNNVLTHEGTVENIEQALKEYARVLKSDGIVFIETIGEKDIAYQNSKIIDPPPPIHAAKYRLA
jgi:ubiquinone/menaquinone biosynthesis C-methylase UbiE